jgi:hypothetical protein
MGEHPGASVVVEVRCIMLLCGGVLSASELVLASYES